MRETILTVVLTIAVWEAGRIVWMVFRPEVALRRSMVQLQTALDYWNAAQEKRGKPIIRELTIKTNVTR